MVYKASQHKESSSELTNISIEAYMIYTGENTNLTNNVTNINIYTILIYTILIYTILMYTILIYTILM